MKITELSIKKPIAVIMILMLFIMIGVMGYINLGADLFPEAKVPVVFITSVYPGAGAEEVEKNIIKPIEDAVSSISGIDKIQSTAYEGLAEVVIMFKMSADTNAAVMDTQKALDSLAGELPKDAMRPSLFKYDQNAEPILVVTLSGDKPFEQIQHESKDIKERIERVPGVGRVSIYGGREKELLIRLDKVKLDFYSLSIAQVAGRLQVENVNIPGGTIHQSGQDKIISIDGEFNDINEIKTLRIPLQTGYVELGEISQISLAYPKIKELSRSNGKKTVVLAIQKQSDANIVKTGKEVKKELERLKESLKGTELQIVQDSTVFITSSLNETQINLIEGIITTAIVLFFFLRQWNSVFIVIVAIPASIISTFFMMYVYGFTFNLLSLMGLALCVGILVDDSVVVLENIHRHLTMGKSPKQAALDGRSEIGMAAIAITLSDIVVFAPIAFMSGMVGQYFKQFGLTVVTATLFSLIVSFTLTPMMASRLFKMKKKESKKKSLFEAVTSNIGVTVKRAYQAVLLWALDNRLKVIGIVILLIALSVSLIPLGLIGSDFLPRVDQGDIAINIDLTPGSTIEKTNEKVEQVEKYISTMSEMKYYYTRVGLDNLTNKAYMYVKLVDKNERKAPQKEIVDRIRQWGKENLSGVNFTVSEIGLVNMGNGNKPILVNAKGSNSEVIKEIADKAEEIVRSVPGTVDVSNSLEAGQPEVSIEVNRLAANQYGVSALDVSNAVRASIEGAKAGIFRKDGEEYDIKVKLIDNQVVDINNIKTLKIINNKGQSVSLEQVAKISLSESPTFIKRLNKLRVANITANLKEGYTLGEVNSQIASKLDQLSTPEGYSINIGGEQEEMDETFSSLIQALILSVILVYIVLGVLYESFLTPFVRLLALPVGIVGALCMLAITGKSLNMLSLMGLIMLDGLAAKNGTLLIDYTNTLMSRGMSLRDALYDAVSTRLKPIMMTSVAMVVGMSPTALSLAEGSEYKSGMAVVIIGGIITSTILSPIVLPVAYTLMIDFNKWLKRKMSLNKPPGAVSDVPASNI